MRRYVFADEAGCFAFKRGPNISRYFIICTVTLDTCDIGARLLNLRRELVWEGLPVGDYFHAATDKQAVRDRVFDAIQAEGFTVDATLLEKDKAQPQTRATEERFYQYAWYYHFFGVHRMLLGNAGEVLITAASVGTHKKKSAFAAAVKDVAGQYYRNVRWQTCHPSSAADPCLQLADYCTWAIQRKWERGDTRSYDLIKSKIRHEYDSWARGAKRYY